MPHQIKSTFNPPDQERATCPYCGYVIHARWVTNTEVEVTGEVCAHYVGHDRTGFFFDNPRRSPWDWDAEKTQQALKALGRKAEG